MLGLRPHLERHLHILQCPAEGAPLRLDGEVMRSDSGRAYPLLHGKPVLVREALALHTTPPQASIISRNSASFAAPGEVGPEGVVVHLGCGDVPSDDPRVISVDVIPTDAADIIAEAEALPFADESVDYVFSGATFEHVTNPIAAGREVRRVLKKGGGMFIDTAFLQGYHGFPSHFFNMTAQAVETYVAGDLDVEYSSGSPSGSPAIAIFDLIERLFQGVDQATADHLRSLSVQDFIDTLRAEHASAGPILTQLPEHVRRSLSAAILVIARKPHAYEPLSDEGVLVQYYAARAGIIQYHFEANFHRAARRDPLFDPPDLQELLASAAAGPWPERLQRAREAEARMDALRHHWAAVACGQA